MTELLPPQGIGKICSGIESLGLFVRAWLTAERLNDKETTIPMMISKK